MTQTSPDTFAACVGIDWADAKHDICLQAANSAKRECCQLAHPPEAIDAWVTTLRTRFGGRLVAICLELTKGPLVSALCKYDFLVLFPLNPLTLARYREAFTPRRAKDDPTDAELQLARLLTHRDTLPALQPQSAPMRALAQRVEHRRRVVGEKVRLTNRLTRTLKNSFPHVWQWFQDTETPIFCDFLSRWPPLKAAQLARRSTLETFLHDHHVRGRDVLAKRGHAMKTATPLTADEGVIAPNTLLVQTLVRQLRVTVDAIAAFDQAIAQHAQRHPAFPLLQALPGAGPVFASRLLVAFGEQRERYAAAALQKYAGIAPVTERSGKKAWVHWRLQCPKVLRQSCVEWAAASIRHAFWAQVYYQQQREKGKAHQAAVRALAFKWIRLLYRCWQERTPYDEAIYLQALSRRGSSLLHHLAKEAGKS
jgi:transposase